MQSPESAPQTAPVTPEKPEHLIEVPVWQEPSTPVDIPVFEAPQPTEAPVTPEPIGDVKVDHITVIDPEGVEPTRVVQLGRQGGLYGTEMARTVEVQPAPNAARANRLTAALRKLFPRKSGTPESR